MDSGGKLWCHILEVWYAYKYSWKINQFVGVRGWKVFLFCYFLLQICVHSSSYFLYYLYWVDICERVVKDLYLTNYLQQLVEMGLVDMRVINRSFTAEIKRCLEKLELIHIVALITKPISTHSLSQFQKHNFRNIGKEYIYHRTFWYYASISNKVLIFTSPPIFR